MSTFKAFYKENRKQAETIKVKATKNFVDEKGEVLDWEVRKLTSKEGDEIREACTVLESDGTTYIDNNLLSSKIAATCTVYPDLNDKGLQDSYGVMGAEALLKELINLDGEYQNYVNTVMVIADYKSVNELREQVKN